MTVGEKIRVIRTFRGMTQKELGLSVGFDKKGADNRIAQYETDYRVRGKEMLDKIGACAECQSSELLFGGQRRQRPGRSAANTVLA